MADVTMPQLGETVTEGTITRWFKNVGDTVEVDEALFEVSTDKVDTEVPSPIAGVVSEILAATDDLVEVGQVLARIGAAPDADPVTAPPAPVESAASVLPLTPVESAASEPSSAPGGSVVPEPPPAVSAPAPAAPAASPSVDEPSATAQSTPPAPSGSVAPSAEGLVLSPVVRRLIAENDIDPSTLTGTGRGGRITRADVEQVVRARASAAARATSTPPQAAATEPPAAAPQAETSTPPRAVATEPPADPPSTERHSRPAAVPAVPMRSGDRLVPLNNIRRRTAQHMVMSKQTSAHVLTAMEVDYEGVEAVRRATKSAWKAEEGFSLTYLPFIARAVIDALRDYPHLNASFSADGLVVHAGVNLAVAVDIDFDGLLAPVISGAEGKRLRQIARDIVDLANRARSRQLGPDDLTGGTFTLTNAGQYGTMMQFPIINQPQVAILSTDGVKRKPVVVTDAYGNESIAVHSVGVLAMAWDHRAFDGAYAAAFLHRVKELIETRDWEAEIR